MALNLMIQKSNRKNYWYLSMEALMEQQRYVSTLGFLLYFYQDIECYQLIIREVEVMVKNLLRIYMENVEKQMLLKQYPSLMKLLGKNYVIQLKQPHMEVIYLFYKLYSFLINKLFLKLDSYGGYMSAILASRFSENFVCAILSNPVISMPFNIHITGNNIILFILYSY